MARFNNGSLDVHAWEAISADWISKAIRTNPVVLEKGGDLLKIGFQKPHLRTFASVNDVNAFDIAKRLRQHHGIDYEVLTQIVDRCYKMGTDCIVNIEKISKGPGKLLDAEKLNKHLKDALKQNNGVNHGVRLSLEDGAKRVGSGSEIAIENTHADLEDFTKLESVQHKLTTGGEMFLESVSN